MIYRRICHYSTINDERVQNLRNTLGVKGYGIYWYIVELLFENNGILSLKMVPHIPDLIDATEIEVNRVVYSFNLFIIKGEYFVLNKNISGRYDEIKYENFN